MRINTHIHTPYSFSSFESIDEAVLQAKEEGVSVLGINDLNTIEGYGHFAEMCSKNTIYPLFNIEFATLIESDKAAGFKWNDITYPGVMYLCGKALDFPVAFNSDSKNLIGSVWKISQDRIWKMISKLNQYFQTINIDITLDYNAIRTAYAKHAVLERHIAKAIFTICKSKWCDQSEFTQKLKVLFQDNNCNLAQSDAVAIQDEIRLRLLKPGKVGYVEEYYANHVRFYEARTLILSAGGIPCYPFLLDSSIPLTDKERNVDFLISELLSLDIRAVEFISHRVNIDVLKKYARRFYEKGFIVTFGTEHRTLEKFSLVPQAQNGVPFDDELIRIGYDGACIYAAHQEMHHQKCPGFVDDMGKRLVHPARVRDFIRIGDDVIKRSINHSDAHEMKWYEPSFS